MRTVLAVGLVVAGILILGLVGLVTWVHHVYAVGASSYFDWKMAAWLFACGLLVATGIWLFPRRRTESEALPRDG
jgi:membrane protein implicated in regulation of membrane protease activity